MDYHVVEARYVGGHIVWLRFRDGTAGEIDLASVLEGPVFEPLRDPATFSQFQIHPEFHTLTWPNGADFAPEFLHDNVQPGTQVTKLTGNMGNTFWVTEVKNKGLWQLWETALLAVFQGAVDAFSASTAPAASTAGFPNWGVARAEK